MPVDRTRKQVWEKVDSISFSEFDYSTKITDLADKFKDLAERYPNAVTDVTTYPYEDTKYIAVSIPVPETDEQMAKRIAEEEKNDAIWQKRERKEFERLQAKYGEKK